MKLIEKRREGSRVYKRYDRPQTPYQRLMGSDDVSQEIKQQLEDQFQALNLAALNREIRKTQEELGRMLCPVGDRLRKAG